MPSYKNKKWDGKLRFFSMWKKTIPYGLASDVYKFAKENNYTILIDPCYRQINFSETEAKEFISTLNIPEQIEPWEHQIDAFVKAIRYGRTISIMATSAGKSLTIYFLSRYYSHKKQLIIVPTVNLVNQLASDFKEYNDTRDVTRIYDKSGYDKYDIQDDIVITTWQSIVDLEPEWFEQFEFVVGDEVHGWKAKSLLTIAEKCPHIHNRFGFTGTLDGKAAMTFTVQGIFGPIIDIISLRELIDKGHATDISIKAIVLEHPENVRAELRKYHNKNKDGRKTYQMEKAYLFANEARNNFITNLACSLKGNTLILVWNVESHGHILAEILKSKANNFNYVYGGVDADEREEIRQFVRSQDSSITLATFQTFSTGINIPNLHNLIFAAPSKAMITIMQSLGRTVRLHDSKDKAKVFDIADNLSLGSFENHTIRQFLSRCDIYDNAEIEYEIFNVNLD